MGKGLLPFEDFLALRISERKKAEPRLQANSDELAQLIHMFPDIDRDYASFCLQHYTSNRVASVTVKLLDVNFSSYPRHNFADSHEARNELLDQLNELFPEHDVAELRQALSMQSRSNLYRAVDDLSLYELKAEKETTGKVNLRTRVGVDRGIVEPHQRFRSEEYQSAVYKRLKLEFAQYDSPATIRALLGEHNYDYGRTRTALLGLFTKKSLWSIFKGLFSSRAKEMAEKQLRQQPNTGCAELDAEIAEITNQKRQVETSIQIENDLTLARQYNESQYSEAQELLECGCCFGEYTWEEMTACTAGHLVCHTCITHTAQECAFGQGDNAYDPRGLCCIAASNEKCNAVIPTRTLERVLSTDLMTRLTTRITSTDLDSASLDLVRCPFCIYAEFKDPPVKIRLRPIFRPLVAIFLFFITLLCPFILANITVPLIICVYYTDLLEWKDFKRTVNDVYQRRYGSIQEGSRSFKCLNTDGDCGRESCLECGKEWAPFHDCLKDEKDGLRLYVEKAMADAVKRTCPRCHVGFIKADGCNLMHCRCGFVMCYICRQDVEKIKYQHFCQHFRPLGGACTICNKCGLYDKEDEDEAVNEARIRAQQEYLARHPKAATAARVTVREAYLARRPTAMAPVTIPRKSYIDECVEFIMEYGKDWLFETYS